MEGEISQLGAGTILAGCYDSIAFATEPLCDLFTRGQNAAIGFHDIPVNRGHKVQTVAQLGTPTSHGCIRQRPADAKVMWGFADLGTKVDVVA